MPMKILPFILAVFLPFTMQCYAYAEVKTQVVEYKDPHGVLSHKDYEISPAEDLMREHGVLRRILLIYEETLRRIEQKEDIQLGTLNRAAHIVKTFIEEYHEKLEEDYIFPLFDEKGTIGDLASVLRKQHTAGRMLTRKIINLSGAGSAITPESLLQLTRRLRQFIRLYRPHAAREDTVLFPVLSDVISARGLAVLGDKFEDKEHELFGEDGFKKIVADVARLEQSLDIYDLSQFTPRE